MRRFPLILVVLALHACGDDLECGDGTAKRGKVCVPAEDLCPDGQIWAGGECRTATTCGEGTVNVGGRCVPEENLCDPGQVYLDGGCVEQCGAGTLVDVASGSCVPVDPTAGATPEVEPNDPLQFNDTPNAIALPAQDQAVRVSGTIAAPTDLDGDGDRDDDFDFYSFDATAGTRLVIEATAVGAPEVAFGLYYHDPEPPVGYEVIGAALPLASRNAIRQVVLPYTGTYYLGIAEATAFAGVGLGWTGGDGFTYVAAVTPITNPAPTTSTTGDFEATGDLSDVPQFLLDVSAGDIIEAWLSADDTTPAYLRMSSSDHSDPLGQVLPPGPRSFRVPSGGLLVTADYAISYEGRTGFQLRTIEHAVTPLDLSVPVSRPDDPVPPGSVRYYSVPLATDRVLGAQAWSAGSDADVYLALLDDALEPVALSNDFGPGRSVTVALSAGDYTLAVYEIGSLPDTPGVFTVDLTIDSWPLVPVGTGTLDSSVTHIETVAITFAAVGERAYLSAWVDAVGSVDVVASPTSELDLALSAHDRPLLARGDGPVQLGRVDDLGPGEAESFALTAGPRQYFFRVDARDVFAASTADITLDLTVDPTPYVVGGSASETVDLGTLSTTAQWGFGDLTGGAADTWMFTVAQPGWVRLETSPYGAAVDDTVLVLWDGVNQLAEESGGGVGEYTRLDLVLDAGVYHLVVETPQPDGDYYILEAVVDEDLACMPGNGRCVGSDLSVCDAGGQSETPVTCTSGCASDRCIGIAEAVAANDTWVDAQDLDSGATLAEGRTVVDGAIDDAVTGRDMDWYSFTLDAAAVVTVSTTGPTWLDTELWLYGEHDTPPPDLLLVANNDNAPGTVFSRIGPEVVAAGEYWVRVGYAADRTSQAGDYQLNIDIELLACFPDAEVCNGGTLELCNGDGSAFASLVCSVSCSAGACAVVGESESNDSDTTSDDLGTITLGVRAPITGQIGAAGDADWYRFELTANALVRIETVPIVGGSDADTVVSLFATGDTSTPLATDDDGGTGAYSLIDTFLTPDVYFVEVTGSVGDYLLVIDVVTPECTGTETRCDDTLLQECELGRWGDWPCVATCGGAPAVCEPLSAEVVYPASFGGPGTTVHRFGAGAGEKLNFVAAAAATLDVRIILCAAGTPQCDWFNGWIRRANTSGTGSTDSIIDWVVPSTGEYVLWAEQTAGTGTAMVTVTPVPVPRLTAADYPIAARGGRVVFTGENLADIDTLTIGGLAVGFTIDSDTQITIDALPDDAPVGVDLPVALSSSTLGAGAPFQLTVMNLLISEIDANTPGVDTAQLVEVTTGLPGVDLTGAGYVVVFVNGSDTAPGEAYRSGIQLDAVADAGGLILLGNAGASPDIVFNDDLQNGYDALAIVQAASVTNGSDISGERIIDAVAYQAGSSQGSLSNLAFLWLTGAGVVDEGIHGAVETESLQRCALARRATNVWQASATTAGAVNACSGGNSTNIFAVPGTPQPIPDGGMACFELTIPTLPFGNQVTAVRALATLDHGFAGQIEIRVIDPANTTIYLINSVGSFYDFVPAYPITFEDGATPLANILDTVVGASICGDGGACTFNPQQPLSSFAGAGVDGVWNVCIADNTAGVAGEIDAFALEITTTP